MVIAKNL